MANIKRRLCSVCYCDCARKKVWSQHGRWVICMACGAKGWSFNAEGQPVNEAWAHDTMELGE